MKKNKDISDKDQLVHKYNIFPLFHINNSFHLILLNKCGDITINLKINFNFNNNKTMPFNKIKLLLKFKRNNQKKLCKRLNDKIYYFI